MGNPLAGDRPHQEQGRRSVPLLPQGAKSWAQHTRAIRVAPREGERNSTRLATERKGWPQRARLVLLVCQQSSPRAAVPGCSAGWGLPHSKVTDLPRQGTTFRWAQKAGPRDPIPASNTQHITLRAPLPQVPHVPKDSRKAGACSPCAELPPQPPGPGVSHVGSPLAAQRQLSPLCGNLQLSAPQGQRDFTGTSTAGQPPSPRRSRFLSQ